MRARHGAMGRIGAPFALVGIVVTSCGLLEPAPTIGEPPPSCGFPTGTALDFGSETTLSLAGLERGGGMADVTGDLYVTALPISLPERGATDLHERDCMVYPPDAGITQIDRLVPANWAPPAAP